MPAQGRLGDRALNPADAHGCPGCAHSVIGPAVSGSANVLVNGRPALRVDDAGIHTACCGPNTWNAFVGSCTVFINGKPAHRKTDDTLHCGGMGTLVEGSHNVIVGGGRCRDGVPVDPGQPVPRPPGRPPSSGSTGSPGSSAPPGAGSNPPGSVSPGPGSGGGTPPRGGPGGDPPGGEHKTFIEVELLDERGDPVAGERYKITTPDGEVRTGRLDARGLVRIDGLDPGLCKVEFPELDAHDWGNPLPPQPALPPGWITPVPEVPTVPPQTPEQPPPAPPPRLLTAEWDRPTGKLAERAQMQVEAADLPPGTVVRFEVHQEVQGQRAPIGQLEILCVAGRASAVWEDWFQPQHIGERLALDSSRGEHFPAVRFFFRASALGEEMWSGSATYEDFLNARLLDDNGEPLRQTGYVLHSPWGTLRCRTDEQGTTRADQLPPGGVSLELNGRLVPVGGGRQ